MNFTIVTIELTEGKQFRVSDGFGVVDEILDDEFEAVELANDIAAGLEGVVKWA